MEDLLFGCVHALGEGRGYQEVVRAVLGTAFAAAENDVVVDYGHLKEYERILRTQEKAKIDPLLICWDIK